MADIGYRNGFRAVSEGLLRPHARGSQHRATFLAGLVSIRPRCVGSGVRGTAWAVRGYHASPASGYAREDRGGATPVTNLMPYVTENGA